MDHNTVHKCIRHVLFHFVLSFAVLSFVSKSHFGLFCIVHIKLTWDITGVLKATQKSKYTLKTSSAIIVIIFKQYDNDSYLQFIWATFNMEEVGHLRLYYGGYGIGSVCLIDCLFVFLFFCLLAGLLKYGHMHENVIKDRHRSWQRVKMLVWDLDQALDGDIF